MELLPQVPVTQHRPELDSGGKSLLFQITLYNIDGPSLQLLCARCHHIVTMGIKGLWKVSPNRTEWVGCH